jgi:mycothiol synthase
LIGAPGSAGASLRAADPSEADAVQAIWESSNYEDDPVGWPRGGWSVAAWATHSRVLVLDGRLVGVAALRAERTPDGAMPGRLALEVSARHAPLAEMLVQATLDMVREAHGKRARLFVPGRAEWTQTAVAAAGFKQERTIAHMLLPAEVPTPEAPPLDADLRLRSIQPGEDERVLAALNRAWAGTWNFVTITLSMLQHDLVGQREGMLLAVDASDHIRATCHAVFDPTSHNPDGNPRAWISNLTVDPDFRGRGISRAMLAAGIAHLRSRGATSVTLGVDADNPAPFRLYTSVGFEIASRLEAWDAFLSS